MSVHPYEELIRSYVSDIQEIRKICFDECLNKIRSMDVSKYDGEQVMRLAHRIGAFTFSQFAAKIREKYSGDKNMNLIEMSISAEKKFFTGLGPFYLPQEIIDIFNKKI